MIAQYIGILTPGSTCRMRAETLRRLTPGWKWRWTDTDAPMLESHRIWQSAAYRLNSGPAVMAINRLVTDSVSAVDLAWVDKAVFLYPRTIDRLRASSRNMVHFTPDTAFHANRSRHFEKTLGTFDVPLKLHRQVTAALKVQVVREGAPRESAPPAGAQPAAE